MLKKKIIDGYQPVNQRRGAGRVKDVLFWVLSPSLLRKGKQQKHLKHVGEHADTALSPRTLITELICNVFEKQT